ncbi:hypothetical protein SNOG_02401 [Parastagonospora nodorum SN15]|uniref:Ketoreductase (KR) domain-containing protein n=2 Tax=Phaeosphaeria nodorum (strain SN15 / ATCC MYA-4574 / FGSC 10173) TaxID=321614 RepID=Q0V0R3_PHANO|nr:hypothetical protein SNOG_02401 [Parastagonospora nodorum SN15]EAT90613.1 hypothetical protein SNOG_02401 [Parastagonospora nodorum SN15]
MPLPRFLCHRNLTLPADFTTLVTGARLNLGYPTALRLLRCGARVIATTRYPRDAVARYLNEDSGIWKERLEVVGADFRRIHSKNQKRSFALGIRHLMMYKPESTRQTPNQQPV